MEDDFVGEELHPEDGDNDQVEDQQDQETSHVDQGTPGRSQ